MTQIETTAAGGQESTGAHLLEVNDLHVEFRTPYGVVQANRGVSYHVDPGETVAILGESGSGKSVSAQAVMGIIDSPPGFITKGEILYRGNDLLKMTEKQRRKIRGAQTAIIFQDALSALNPVFTVGYQIAEMYRTHNGTSKRDAFKQAGELMDRVKIPLAKERLKSYPHEFSGGMRQRVMIAMALTLNPDLLIADEPTTALDVTVQAQIMLLLSELQSETGMGLVLITHDLGVVADVSERVAVMYAGKIVETGSVWDVYDKPAHPYTAGLMASIPRADAKGQQLNPIMGSPPNLDDIPSGCSFRPRCPLARERCAEEIPPLRRVKGEWYSACHFFEELHSA
ncbi:MAG: ABC transporter ATP-binding protein [Euzebya sp.]